MSEQPESQDTEAQVAQALAEASEPAQAQQPAEGAVEGQDDNVQFPPEQPATADEPLGVVTGVAGFKSGDAASVQALHDQKAADTAAEHAKAAAARRQSAPARLARRRQTFKDLCDKGTVTVGAGQPRLREEQSEEE